MGQCDSHAVCLTPHHCDESELKKRLSEGAVTTVGLSVQNTAGIGGEREYGVVKRKSAVLVEVKARCVAGDCGSEGGSILELQRDRVTNIIDRDLGINRGLE